MGPIVDVKKIALLAEKLDYDAELQNILFTYYLPLPFKGLEEGDHVPGTDRVSVIHIPEFNQTNSPGNIIQRVQMIEQQYQYLEQVSSAILLRY
ncbi:unnamed protein product [Enterobius vermicularis]|uniref:Pyr_redox_dim domain-containing protein n=1 Tax=Enterobius vermicularis TaxID=51028 RepID=A0A0N4VD29_ENTVE|nr:unnamed protein product [Enterobius vermicularis]